MSKTTLAIALAVIAVVTLTVLHHKGKRPSDGHQLISALVEIEADMKHGVDTLPATVTETVKVEQMPATSNSDRVHMFGIRYGSVPDILQDPATAQIVSNYLELSRTVHSKGSKNFPERSLGPDASEQDQEKTELERFQKGQARAVINKKATQKAADERRQLHNERMNIWNSLTPEVQAAVRTMNLGNRIGDELWVAGVKPEYIDPLVMAVRREITDGADPLTVAERYLPKSGEYGISNEGHRAQVIEAMTPVEQRPSIQVLLENRLPRTTVIGNPKP